MVALGKLKEIFKTKPLLVLLCLAAIVYIAIYTRLSTLESTTVLDYDPWWHYREAKAIYDNGFKVPSWDTLSYYPPGRPPDRAQGWEYTMAIFYAISSFFSHASFMEVAKLSPVIMVALTAIPAFLLGRLISNKWGGLATAVFATLPPTFIGVSMAGYSDTDAVVVFYMMLCVYSTLLALKKRKLPYYAFAIVTNLAFVYTWTGWVVLLLFAAFVPLLIVFRAVEEIVHQRRLKIGMGSMLHELKSVFLPLVIVAIGTSVVSYLCGIGIITDALPVALSFSGLGGQPLLVNISVAELQPINVFEMSGFLQIIGRVGLAPIVFAVFGLPMIVAYKVYKKERIDFVEIFLFMWFLITFYMITRGVRFALLFSAAAAASGGYVVGQMGTHKKVALFILVVSLIFSMSVFSAEEKLYMVVAILLVAIVAFTSSFKRLAPGVLEDAAIFGVTALLIAVFVSSSIQTGNSMGGMEISSNWYDMMDWLKEHSDNDTLVMTWWDPGHIITGYTGLKVQADGAHCGPGKCIPYNHNIRIQDTGRMFTTDDENVSLQLIRKYTALTSEQCELVRDTFGSIVPENACDPVTQVYIIASSDLIGKYYWMSFFGDCLKKFGLNSSACYESIDWFKNNAQGRSYLQVSLTGIDQEQGVLQYGGGQVLLAMKDNKWIPLLNMPDQNIRNVVVRDVVYYESGSMKSVTYENATSAIDGMVWVDPSYQTALFMDAEVRDSIFTRMFFFNGEGLENFELVYSNPEIRLFKVVL